MYIKKTSISNNNTVIRKSTSESRLDESQKLSLIKRFLSSKNRRSLSEDLNFLFHKLPEKPSTQAKTFINQSPNPKKGDDVSNNAIKSSQDIIFSNGSSSFDLSLKKNTTNNTSYRLEEGGLRLKTYKSNTSSDANVSSPRTNHNFFKNLPKGCVYNEMSSKNILYEPVYEGGNEDLIQDSEISRQNFSINNPEPAKNIKMIRRESSQKKNELESGANSKEEEKRISSSDKQLEELVRGFNSSLALKSSYQIKDSLLKPDRSISTVEDRKCCFSCLLI